MFSRYNVKHLSHANTLKDSKHKPALIQHANAHIDNVNMLMFVIFV